MTESPYEFNRPARSDSPYDYCEIPLPDDSDAPPESPYQCFDFDVQQYDSRTTPTEAFAGQVPEETPPEAFAGQEVPPVTPPEAYAGREVFQETPTEAYAGREVPKESPPDDYYDDFSEADVAESRLLRAVRSAPPDTILSYVVPAIDVEPAEHEFLLGDMRFPIGEVTIIAGAGGTGKGQLAAAHMAYTSRGYNLSGIKAGSPQNCLFITAEDTAEDVKRRLVRSCFKADGSHIFIIDKTSAYNYALDLSDTDDTLRLDAMIRCCESPLVYLDPLQAFVGEYADLSRQNQVRHIMHTLASIAERTHCCIVLIMHLNKRQSIANAAELLCGSSDIVNASRSVMLLTNDFKSGDVDTRYLFHIKSNHARRAETLQISITSAGNRVVGECEVDVEEYVQALNTRKLAKSSRSEVNYEQMFYDGIEKMIANGETQSTFREFTQRFAQGFQGRAKCILDDITARVEEKLGYTIQTTTSGSSAVKIGTERGFRIISLS